MCYANRDLNKDCIGMVGGLQGGEQYRTPDGVTMLVTAERSTLHTTCVNMTTGELVAVANDVKLGRDRAYRLYASRYLNPPAQEIVVV